MKMHKRHVVALILIRTDMVRYPLVHPPMISLPLAIRGDYTSVRRIADLD